MRYLRNSDALKLIHAFVVNIKISSNDINFAKLYALRRSKTLLCVVLFTFYELLLSVLYSGMSKSESLQATADNESSIGIAPNCDCR